MRLLLPPSESKRDGTDSRPLDLASLTAPQLAAPRARVVNALAKFCAKPTPKVRTAIGTTINQDAELQRNASLLRAHTAPAHHIYSGVLFDAIALDGCAPATRGRITERVLVQSALLGVVGFGDAIPAYRCSADSSLPLIDRLGRFWRGRLGAVMPALLDDHLLLDLRSGSYASMWTPSGEMRERTVLVRVMQERGGRRLAVSHMNKATKGQLVRALCEPAGESVTVDDAAGTIAAAGFDVEVRLDGAVRVLEVLAR